MAVTNSISVYGATGFIGSVFCKMYPESLVQPRDLLTPQSPNILNFVSTTDNYNVFNDPFLDILTNQSFMLHVLEEARRKYGNMFTFNMVSSWFVYGQTDLPAREDSCCTPRGFYSITKRAAEQLLISYCETHGIHYRIFRLANVLGIEDRGVSEKKNALQFLIRRIVNKEPIQLYLGGNFIRDYIDVRDACSAMHLVMEKGTVDEIYNVSNGVPLQFLDIINLSSRLAKKAPTFIMVEPTEFHQAVQAKDMWLDNTKIKGLGYRPRFSLENTLSRIIYHYGDKQTQAG